MRCAGDVPVCDPKTMYECETPALIHYVRHNEADNCHCPRQCRRRSYRYRISQARLSNFIALTAKNIWKSSESVDKILNDHCSLEVSSQ